MSSLIRAYTVANNFVKWPHHFDPDHWLGAYRTNALYSGHIFVRFNVLRMCLCELCCLFTVGI